MGKKSTARNAGKPPFRESDFAGRPPREQADLSGSFNQLSQQLAATQKLLTEIEGRLTSMGREGEDPPQDPEAPP